MVQAQQVGGGHCSVPPSFDNAYRGSDAPDPTPQPSHGDPNRALMLAVLERALADARGPTARSSGASCAMVEDRQAAIRFLTQQRGAHAQWRRKLCFLCGLDPAAMDRMVERERHLWPPLSEYSTPGRRQERHSRHRSSEGRGDGESRREQAREAMRRKRARERAQPAESYSRRALATGTAMTFPTFRD